ncbi:hypothetical protein DFH06DRAFT_1177372 [Mycena polygramma]|nr:hypothetical protein DFH06DRAFT_1177372 [Mycena polygramma]
MRRSRGSGRPRLGHEVDGERNTRASRKERWEDRIGWGGRKQRAFMYTRQRRGSGASMGVMWSLMTRSYVAPGERELRGEKSPAPGEMCRQVCAEGDLFRETDKSINRDDKSRKSCVADPDTDARSRQAREGVRGEGRCEQARTCRTSQAYIDSNAGRARSGPLQLNPMCASAGVGAAPPVVASRFRTVAALRSTHFHPRRRSLPR